MPRVPLLAGTRVLSAEAPPGSLVLRPRAPGETIADVGAAVRDALRFPLEGEPLDAIVRRGGRATIVVEPPALPIPAPAHDPRREAIAAASDELARLDVPTARQTIVVAGGLARRLPRAELETLVPPEFRRRFAGRVEVHDVERPDLVEIEAPEGDRPALRVHPALVETDLVLTVTAAETVVDGGPGALVAAGAADLLRTAAAPSLLVSGGSPGWERRVEVERALGRRVPVAGVSLALAHPRFGGALRGYPYEEAAVERVASSRTRPLFGMLPGAVRRRVLQSLGAEAAPVTVFAGRPSVAHAEALLRAIEARATTLDRPVDAICLGVPHATAYLPRERPNPLLAATLALGHALRLWRDAFPVTEGGTAVLVHPFDRRFEHPTQTPYRAFFAAARLGLEAEALAAAERAAAADERALEAYRAGRSCHPLLPFADWEACRPAREQLGSVLVAGCRDAPAARQLGFVPARGVGAALEMARGRAGETARVAFLLSPPYFPLVVGER